MRRTCDFCFRMCSIEEGKRGVCGIRENRGDAVVTVNYGQVLAAAADPIEKKPLYHVRPGEKTLSAALFGCNYSCRFCQNHDLSQKDSPLFPAPWKRDQERTEPKQQVRRMQDCGVSVMSYTYSDPVVWQDFMLDTARLVKEADGINCMVTNGSFSPQSLKRVLPLIDAFNIDVKGDDEFYQRYCGATLKPVLDAVEKIAKERGRVMEITTMLIEGIHEIEDVYWLGRLLKDAGVQVWHLSRFFPHYHLGDHNPTSEVFLQQALDAAESCGIPYIYAGNSGNTKYAQTRCPECSHVIVSRRGYYVKIDRELQNHVLLGRCTNCGASIYGIY